MSSSHNSKYSVPDSNEPWDLLIGEISAPQGLHGEVRVYPHTDFPERFEDMPRVALQRNNEPARVVEIEYSRIVGQRIVLKLAGVDTIDQAEALRHTRLLIPHSWSVELGENEYYYHQLLGLEVVTTTGDSLGKIIEIWPTGANDVYETPLALIPAVKEYVLEVDLDHGRMLVLDRPGLRKNEPGE
ncbi:MAG: ribosome maturation factor RimM [Armatimonadota bacterium]